LNKTVEHPTGFRGPNIVLGISLVPVALWFALVAWWFAYFRPSGLERWGDGVILFYVLFAAYPTTLVLGLIGGVWALLRSRKWQLHVPRLTVALVGIAVVVLVALPAILLISRYSRANEF
jgi:hypothetical protein